MSWVCPAIPLLTTEKDQKHARCICWPTAESLAEQSDYEVHNRADYMAASGLMAGPVAGSASHPMLTDLGCIPARGLPLRQGSTLGPLSLNPNGHLQQRRVPPPAVSTARTADSAGLHISYEHELEGIVCMASTDPTGTCKPSGLAVCMSGSLMHPSDACASIFIYRARVFILSPLEHI